MSTAQSPGEPLPNSVEHTEQDRPVIELHKVEAYHLSAFNPVLDCACKLLLFNNQVSITACSLIYLYLWNIFCFMVFHAKGK